MIKKRTVRIVIVCLLLAVVVMVVLVGFLFGVSFKTDVGKYHVKNQGGTRAAKTDVWEQGFSHEIWDGPTGTFSSGDIYVFKRGNWMWRLDIFTGNPGAGF